MTGINAYPDKLSGREVREVATKAGVDFRNLSSALKGKRGLSLKSAHQIAPLFDAQPLPLYVESQNKAIKAKLDNGEGRSTVLRTVAAVLDELQGLTREEIADAGKALEAAVEELKDLAEQALEADEVASDKPAKEKTATKSRDAAGRRYKEPGNVERDAFGRRLR